MKFISTLITISMLLGLNSLECAQGRKLESKGKGKGYHSYSYYYPTKSPSSKPSPAPATRECLSSELSSQAFYAPALGYCFKIESYRGGKIYVNLNDEDCSKPFVETLVGVYDGQAGNKFQYVKGGGVGGDGVVTFIEDTSVSAASIEVNKFNFATLEYNFVVTVPSCTGEKRNCKRQDVQGKTFIGSINKQNCAEVELFHGGRLSIDLGDADCVDQNFALRASTFDKITKNAVATYSGTYDGTVTVVEDGVPGTEFIMADLDQNAMTFELEIRLRACDL